MNDIKNLPDKLMEQLPRIKRYIPLLFALLLLAIYGFLILRVNVLNGAEPSAESVNSQSKTAQVPHIEPALISQLQSLQDNSANVQSLFDQARSNPFQE